jgi:hypothetical protein
MVSTIIKSGYEGMLIWKLYISKLIRPMNAALVHLQ